MNQEENEYTEFQLQANISDLIRNGYSIVKILKLVLFSIKQSKAKDIEQEELFL